MRVSIRTIDFLKDIVTGDSELYPHYRSGPKIVELFNHVCFFDDTYGRGFPSRWLYAKSRLVEINGTNKMANLVKEILNPALFISKEEHLPPVINELNKYLDFDGYQVAIKNKKCRISAIQDKKIDIENQEYLEDDFIQEQISKCESKIETDDYDGAITNARSLLEGTLGFVYHSLSDNKIKKTGDLKKDYKLVRDLLNLSPDKYTDENVKQILNGFASIIEGIDRLSNQMGDRHRRRIKPDRHHAKLAVNAAKTMVDFLHDSYDKQKNR